MAIVFTYPACGLAAELPDSFRGQRLQCSACAGVFPLPVEGAQAPEPVLPTSVLTGQLSKACAFCGERIPRSARKCRHCGEILDRTLARAKKLQEVAEAHYGSRHGRWAPRGVLNRTLTRDGARLVRARTRELGHPAIVAPTLRLLPLPDPRTVTRLSVGPGYLDLADHRGQVEVLREVDLLFLSAGRIDRRPDAPYFLDLFSDGPLARWRPPRVHRAEEPWGKSAALRAATH